MYKRRRYAANLCHDSNKTTSSAITLRTIHPNLGAINASTHDYICYTITDSQPNTFVYTLNLSIVKKLGEFTDYRLGTLRYHEKTDSFTLDINNITSIDEIFYTAGNIDTRIRGDVNTYSLFDINNSMYILDDTEYQVLSRQYPVTATTPIKKVS